MSLTTTTTTTTAGLATGTWEIDPVHSTVEFSVRHLMVSKVRGRFGRFNGTLTVGDDPASSSVTATIDVASVDTGDPGRDEHLRSDHFLDAAAHPTITFVSSDIAAHGDRWVVRGDLTLKGVTRPVELDLEVNGVGADMAGGLRAGFSANTEINRRDFGIDITMPLDGGGVVVGDKVKITLEIAAARSA